MPRIIPIVLAVAVWIYGIIHCVATKSEYMPGRVPKWGWLALNILVPVLGAVVWFVALYMMRNAENEAASTTSIAPDDDPDFLAHLEKENRFRQWERNRNTNTQDNADKNSATQDETQALSEEEILKRLEKDLDEE